MERLLRDNSRLQEITSRLSAARTVVDVAGVIVTSATDLLQKRGGWLYRVTPDGVQLERVVSHNLDADVGHRWERIPLSATTLAAEATRTGKMVVVESLDEWARRFPDTWSSAQSTGVGSGVVVPLVENHRVRGIIGFASERSGPLDPDEVRFLEGLAAQTAVALARAEAFESEQHARRAAEESGRVRDAFLATISHELRTPLNAIVGWADILRRRTVDPSKADRAADVIYANARLQAKPIDELLDMSRIVSGHAQLHLAAVRPAVLVQGAADVVRPAAEAKNIGIEVRVEPGSPAYWCDPQRLQQILWNLLSNAVKFTPSGGRVLIEQRATPSGLEIEVADTGIGIPPDFLPYVFDAFRQADSSTSRQFGGLGLGLAITRHLVELHGGTIRVESPGRGLGSRFVVALPLRPTPAAGDLGPLAPSGKADLVAIVPTERLEGTTVLLVEDDDDAREMTMAALRDSGATVVEFASAAEALTRLDETAVDVIVADVGMPIMDGYAFLREVRARSGRIGSIPAVALTAYVTDSDRDLAAAAGFQAHLGKPVNVGRLLRTIARVTADANPATVP